MMVCIFVLRNSFARMIGRIKSIEAPVVPTRLAINVPIKISTVLNSGVPFSEPRRTMPPEMMNNPPSKMMKGI